ncbi:MAG TPA: choice-of-anchor tandem repeat GloVer-containing protein [Chthoniobacteraceae bacterium]|nr:choice-of-anchor tandem repeat GloVer-containing protein [Chthoniobacteraceae bacterium]
MAPSLHASYFAEDLMPWTAAPGRDGNFYTSLLTGGFNGGSLCQITPKGVLRRFHPFPFYTFSGTAHVLGTNPEGRVSVGQDGAIYGSTRDGGVFGNGVIFKVDPHGASTTLHHFEYGGYKGPTFVTSNGDVYATTDYFPQRMVHLQRDGRHAYVSVPGTTALFAENASHEVIVATFTYGIPNVTYPGKIWRLTPDDQYVLLTDVDDLPRQLILLQDGSFLCLAGDKIVQISESGQLTTVHQFAVPFEGLAPTFLVVGKDGNYYGSTSTGGLERSGTVFKITSDTHAFTVLSHLPPGSVYGAGFVWVNKVLPFWAGALAGNIPPAARDDFVEAASLKLSAAGALPGRAIPVLKNDADANRDPLTILSVGTPAHGVAAFDSVAQKITYTANSTPVENDAFSYTVGDGNGGSAIGQVIVRANAAGQYLGDVSSPANATTGDPGTKVGTLSVTVNAARVYTARLDLLGRVYRFARKFDDWNGSGVVLASNPRLGTSLGAVLRLQPTGAGWTVEATIRKDGLPYAASCVLAPK